MTLEEERRLTYVAITRAEKRFYLTESEGFNYSIGEQKYPSRFLFEINEKFYVQKGEINQQYFREAKHHMAYENARINEETQFKKGDFVNHPIWKLGEIIYVNYEKGEYEVKFIESQIVKPIIFEYKLLEKENDTSLKQEAERKVKEDAKSKATQEPERKEKENVKFKVKQDAERKTKEDAELKAKQEAEKKAKEEAEKVSKSIWNKLRNSLFRK